jgi:hypothetical protein
MNELPFPELREYVESQTFLPEFREIERRGRRQRRRRRAGIALGTAGFLLLMVPALIVGTAMVGIRYGPGGSASLGLAGRGGSGPGVGQLDATPAKPRPPLVRTLVAAGGVDLDHLYGLVDVCSGASCDLQIVSITPSPQVDRLGMLRDRPTQTLREPMLVALNPSTIVVSADVDNGNRQSITVPLAPPDKSIAAPKTAERPVQTAPNGPIQMVRPGRATPSAIPAQPPLSQPTLVATTHSWWVTGTDPVSGQTATAVSTDQGRTWTTRSVGMAATESALATGDGVHAYVLLRIGTDIWITRSVDGGRTWSMPARTPSWPTASQFGLYVRPGGAVMVWLITASGATFLSSTDGGMTFTPTVGPLSASGPVVTVPGGYITLGRQPAISADGLTWTTPYVPYFDVTK